MAHGVHLSRPERQVLADRGTSIAHCPLSNMFFANGILPVATILATHQSKMALGTDVAGGYSLSMLSAMRMAVIAHHAATPMRQNTTVAVTKTIVIDYKVAFWLATLGGARAVGLGSVIGSFVRGKAFDALWINPTSAPIDRFPQDTTSTLFQKFLHQGDSRHIQRRFVRGNEV